MTQATTSPDVARSRRADARPVRARLRQAGRPHPVGDVVAGRAARDRRGRQVPVRVVVVTGLPRNATGKLLKGPLRDAARDSA